MTAIKERSIILRDWEVNAVREGRKTQKRFRMKGAVEFIGGLGDDRDDPTSWGWADRYGDWHTLAAGGDSSCDASCVIPCPHGRVGDRLYVKEGLVGVFDTKLDGETMPIAAYAADRSHAWEAPPDGMRVKWVWKRPSLPSIHMPRRLARVFLEITDVRVERLNDISEADAIAEGARAWLDSLDGRAYDNAEKSACRFTKLIDPRAGAMSNRGVFAAIWESINGEGSWAANPWLWAITFREVGK